MGPNSCVFLCFPLTLQRHIEDDISIPSIRYFREYLIGQAYRAGIDLGDRRA